MKKQNRGITLIALVITIIIMLILAGVTINIAVNGGLFKQAQSAADSTKITQADEQANLIAATAKVDKIANPTKPFFDTVKDAAAGTSFDNSAAGQPDGPVTITDSITGRVYKITSPDYKVAYQDAANMLPTLKVATEWYGVFLDGPIDRTNVESIIFANEIPSNLPDNAWDVSADGDGSVMAWYTDVDNNGLYEVTIGGEGGVAANADSSILFYEFTSLTKLDLNNLNTSNVTDMSYMFEFCSNLTSLDLGNFNTSNVTDISYMFGTCSNLTSLDLSNFDTSNVTTMRCMFGTCTSLTSLDLSSFNTMNVTNMSFMFGSCTSLTSLDLSSFNTMNVTTMNGMFGNCSNLTNLDLSNFDTSNVTKMYYMFNGCSNLTSLDLSNFNTSNVTDMSMMFDSCTNLTSLDLSSFDTSNVTNMWEMFTDANPNITIYVKDVSMRNWVINGIDASGSGLPATATVQIK